ncbi:hypothetical protein BGW80DRAFT_1326669 [Lactifluus volemus]|nr:hypothetical protein BGW80DRAFT_1326669 [Lactifluus volemus]
MYTPDQFSGAMKSQRSNTASRLRGQCAVLFGPSVKDSDLHYSNPQLRNEKFRDRIGWVDNGEGSGTFSNLDVEILHKDYSGSFDLKTAFLNPILMRVYVAIIRGPTSAKELMNGFPSHPRTDTMAQKHGIRHTTPGAIASAVILSRWALSSDNFLQRVGNNTGIHYANDFDMYLRILMTGLRQRKKSILNVFREWDRVIFPNSNSGLAAQGQEISSGLRMAMEMLEADEEEV